MNRYLLVVCIFLTSIAYGASLDELYANQKIIEIQPVEFEGKQVVEKTGFDLRAGVCLSLGFNRFVSSTTKKASFNRGDLFAIIGGSAKGFSFDSVSCAQYPCVLNVYDKIVCAK